MVFAPGADLSWVGETPVVSMEPHDVFAHNFGLEVTGTGGPAPLPYCLQAWGHSWLAAVLALLSK